MPGDSPQRPVEGMVNDVGVVTHWRGQQDTVGTRRLGRWLLVSALLHIPVSPFAPWIGLLGLLGVAPVSPLARDLNEITAIPVELVAADTVGESAAQAEGPLPIESERRERALPERHWIDSLLLPADRGFDRPDAGVDAVAPGDAAAEDATAGDAEAADAGDGGGGPRISNPIALAGAAGAIVDANAPVSIAVYMQNIRRHPLGAKVGQILGRVYQWRDFFGPTGLDPVRDIDRMLIAGPEFNDSSRVVAVIRYTVPDATMKAAVDRIVKARPGAKWLEGKVPVATATADRAPRLFVMPVSHVMVVAPPSAKKSALSLPRTLSRQRDPFPGPKGDEVMVAYVVAPWAAFARARVPVKVPQSIKSASFVLTPTEQGGLMVKVEAEDESPEAAQQHAEELTQAVRAATRIGRGFLKIPVIDRIKFWAEGKLIRGEAVATPDQVALALAFVEPMVTPPETESERLPPVSSAPAPSASGAPPPSPAPSASGASPRTASAPSAAPSGSSSARSSAPAPAASRRGHVDGAAPAGDEL
jgi:hypothetical protein